MGALQSCSHASLSLQPRGNDLSRLLAAGASRLTFLGSLGRLRRDSRDWIRKLLLAGRFRDGHEVWSARKPVARVKRKFHAKFFELEKIVLKKCVRPFFFCGSAPLNRLFASKPSHCLEAEGLRGLEGSCGSEIGSRQ